MTKRTILLVDDDESHRQVMADCVKAHGYAVVQAGHGGEAVEYLKRNDLPDAIVLDLEMPVMGGRELLRKLEATTDWSRIPAIVVSAHTEVSVDAFDRAAARLRKPLDLPTLVEVIERCWKSET